VTFQVTQLGLGPIGQLQVTSTNGAASASWDDWYDFGRVTQRSQLKAGQPFPTVQFTFTASVAGAQIAAAAPLAYSDTLNAQLIDPITHSPRGVTAYLLVSPWGTRAGSCAADGTLLEKSLPPGGCTVLIDSTGQTTS
jgi:hypothetical protein